MALKCIPTTTMYVVAKKLKFLKCGVRAYLLMHYFQSFTRMKSTAIDLLSPLFSEGVSHKQEMPPVNNVTSYPAEFDIEPQTTHQGRGKEGIGFFLSLIGLCSPCFQRGFLINKRCHQLTMWHRIQQSLTFKPQTTHREGGGRRFAHLSTQWAMTRELHWSRVRA